VPDFNERAAPERTPTPAVNKPVACSDTEYEAALWRETDRSLRRDPERWVLASAQGLGFATASRAGDPRETGLRAYVQDEQALVDARRDERRERDRRLQATRERAASLTQSALKGWNTRRARAQAQAPAQDPVR
jgi:hypothetical protein